jgi:TolA-binding protein
MGDWDDEDFEVPVLSTSKAKKDWDDEEEEEVVVKVTQSASQIEANAEKLKKEQITLENKLKYAMLEDETSEEKRARERKQIEDADADLTGDMFGMEKQATKSSASIASGIASVSLKTKADHTSFGVLCAKKMSTSTAFEVAAFYKSFTEKVKKTMTVESCDEILAVFNTVNSDLYCHDYNVYYTNNRE